MDFTPQQRLAIDTRDRTLLVSAAAGSGKTATLTRRVIEAILDEEHPVGINEMLIVTFTRAAAQELRDRIAVRLAEARERAPQNAHLMRQSLLLPSAHICTIDSFCNDLVRDRAGEAGLPIGYRIAEAVESDMLRSSVMSELIDDCHEGLPEVCSPAQFATLTDAFTGSRDSGSLAQILLDFYRRTESYPRGVSMLDDFAARMAAESELPFFETAAGGAVLRETRAALSHYCMALDRAVAAIEQEGNDADSTALPCLLGERESLGRFLSLANAEPACYTDLREAFYDYCPTPLPRKTGRSEVGGRGLALRREIGDLFRRRNRFLRFFAYTEEELRNFLRMFPIPASILSRLLTVFDRRLREEKRRRRLCDYGDLSRGALRLLCAEDGSPTPFALALRESYRAVYIDEYQDVNEVQHAIFSAVSGPHNRFMVGDIKQSIYGFRGGDVDIFAALRRHYPSIVPDSELPPADGAEGYSVFMSQNFRCDRPIIDFTNLLFDCLFGAAGGSIGYREDDRLLCGKESIDPTAGHAAVRMALLPPLPRRQEGEEEAETAEEERAGALRQARLIAREIRRLTEQERLNSGAPIEPRHIAILCRSMKNKAAVIASALEAEGIPAQCEADSDFFREPEILLCLCLLNAIDNPRRDVFLAGVLASPLYGLTSDDLARVRAAADRDLPLFDALVSYVDAHPDFEAGSLFLRELARFRDRAEGMPADALLRLLFDETPLLSLTDGGHGRENLMLLYDYARRFEGAAFKGLHGFIRYIDRVVREERAFSEGGTPQEANAVHILSIHRSKGLEFPVCFLFGCEATFRCPDATAPLLFDPQLGYAFCLPDETGLASVQNPLYHILSETIRRRTVEEELRLLYVALTRARERLYLTAAPRAKTDRLRENAALFAACPDCYAVLRGSGSYLAWILGATYEKLAYEPFGDELPEDAATDDDATNGGAADEANGGTAYAGGADAPPTPEQLDALREGLARSFSFRYPYEYLTRLPAKLSVSHLYPDVLDGDTAPLPSPDPDPQKEQGGAPAEEGRQPTLPRFMGGEEGTEGALRGTATHLFLQFCDYARLRCDGVEAELERLVSRRFMLPEDAARVRPQELERFRRSDLLRRLETAQSLRREFRFHVKLPAADFTADPALREQLRDESVFVQGVMDCVLCEGEGNYTLLDYKTDRLPRDREAAVGLLRRRHALQLAYYSAACEHIFGVRPREVLLYSLALGDTVEVRPCDMEEALHGGRPDQ